MFFDDTLSVKQDSDYWPNVDILSAQYWNNVDMQPGAPPNIFPAINSFWPRSTTLKDLVEYKTTNIKNPAYQWNSWKNNKHCQQISMFYSV